LDEKNNKTGVAGLSAPQSSLVDMIGSDPNDIPESAGIPRNSWIKVVVIGLLLCAFYWSDLTMLVRGWLSDANWSHGFIIPLFSLYLLYNWRGKFFAAHRRVCLWGLTIVILALLVKVYGAVVFPNNWIQQLTIPVMIFGAVLYLCGPRMAAITFVPIFFLALAMPFPDNLYQRISLPLQNFAAKMSAMILSGCGVSVKVTSSHLEIVSTSGQLQELTVAEACSGVRSLMAFVALGVAMAFVEQRAFWQRLVIIFAGIPIAIFVNVIRVTATASMFYFDKPELGKDFMHHAMGMVLLIPALLLLFLLSVLLNRIYVEEDEDEHGDGEPDASESDVSEAGA